MPAKSGFQLQDGDIELLHSVYELRIATIDHLAALSGRSVRALWGRLHKLKERRYLTTVARFMQKQVYALGSEAKPVLVEHGYAPRDFAERRLLAGATFLGIGTPCPEPAPRGGVERRGQLADECLVVGGMIGIGLRDRCHQCFGVGMGGRPVELVGSGELYQLAEVHDGHPITDILHDCQVVGDEDHGEPERGFQVGEQIEDLCLDGDVQGRDRFVADE